MILIEILNKLLTTNRLNAKTFSEKIGLDRPQAIYDIQKGKTKSLSTAMTNKILSAFPCISKAWLLTGEGEMLITKIHPDTLAEAVLVKRDMEARGLLKPSGVPYYENVEATCGIVPQSNDYPEVPAFYINYEHFNDCTAYVPVVGDSMFPQYCSGEIIAVKQILNMDIIQWGEAYFVCTNDDANSLKTIKLIHPHDDESKIILRASNPNYKGDTVINKVDIVSLFVIKGKIKRNQL